MNYAPGSTTYCGNERYRQSCRVSRAEITYCKMLHFRNPQQECAHRRVVPRSPPKRSPLQASCTATCTTRPVELESVGRSLVTRVG